MQLTPRMFSHLVRRHEAYETRQELRLGIVAANIVNFAHTPPKEPACPADFMPSQFGKQRKERELTPQELAEKLRREFAVFG